jgi:HAMP domain-containing protein
MKTTTQVVRPAGAGHETLWVLLASACVLLVAAILIGARAQPLEAVALSAHQIDARTQLNAAEQGVHADLLVAAEEISAMADADKAMPRVEQLRDMDLPPFAAGVGSSARGAHEWRTAAQGHDVAYVGRSAAPDVAASFLLRLSAPEEAEASPKGHAHGGEPEVWVHRESLQVWPAQLDAPSLMRQGWRQVVVRYDAGVTRKDVAR